MSLMRQPGKYRWRRRLLPDISRSCIATQKTAVFLEKLQVETGAYAGGLMDAFYCVRKIDDVVNNAEAKLKSTPAERTDKLLACVLNAYEGWRGDNNNFKADKYPDGAAIITRFNPTLAKSVQEFVKTMQREKIKRKERRNAERAKAKMPVEQLQVAL
jgi:hypothetical protein